VKKGILFGEFRRAIHRSSNDANIAQSIQKVFSRFSSNGYPFYFIRKCFFSYLDSLNSSSLNKDFKNVHFIKAPFINDFYKNGMNRILYNLNLQDHVKFYHKSSNLKSILSFQKEKFSCEPSCIFCPIMARENSCMQKNVIYCVTCNICNVKYIGQTERFLRTRIQEHMTQQSSAVHKHYIEHAVQMSIYNMFKVEILHAHLSNTKRRIQLESIYISMFFDSLMNGCFSVLNQF